MSDELLDLRLRLRPETLRVLQAVAEVRGLHGAALGREVLAEWAEKTLHDASLITSAAGAKGSAGSLEGTPGTGEGSLISAPIFGQAGLRRERV
jgi:hypothetical protein